MGSSELLAYRSLLYHARSHPFVLRTRSRAASDLAARVWGSPVAPFRIVCAEVAIRDEQRFGTATFLVQKIGLTKVNSTFGIGTTGDHGKRSSATPNETSNVCCVRGLAGARPSICHRRHGARSSATPRTTRNVLPRLGLAGARPSMFSVGKPTLSRKTVKKSIDTPAKNPVSPRQVPKQTKDFCPVGFFVCSVPDES